MRELRLRVPAAAAEDVLDRLLPLVPNGVREVAAGDAIELRLRGDGLPSIADLVGAAGPWAHRVTECEVPDDWRERRALDYVPDVIGGRLVVRPEWAPPAEGVELQIVLGSSQSAFGAGTHPTTRTCLEILLGLPAAGALADLGTGTGVLAIAAAKLGWEPVAARDVSPESVQAASEHAARNDVRLDVEVADLGSEPPPASDAVTANVPGWLHERIASGLRERARLALVSGFGPDESTSVLEAYAAHGLRERRVFAPDGWIVAVLGRD